MAAGPIQISAPGLTGALGIKQPGASPNVLLSEIRPVIDLTEWILQQQTQQAGVTITISAGAGTFAGGFYVGTAPVTVPAGRAWFVKNLAGIIAQPPGDVFLPGVFGVGWHLSANNPFVQAAGLLQGAFVTAPTIGQSIIVGAELGRVFGPGTEFGVICPEGTTAAGLSAQLGVEYIDMPL